MNNRWRRCMAWITSLMMILSMVLGLVPFCAFGEEGGEMPEVIYEGALEWLNYLTDEQVITTFDMGKEELAEYLNQIWSHPDIDPVCGQNWNSGVNKTKEPASENGRKRLYSASAITYARMMNTDRLRFMRIDMNDEGSLSLNNGSDGGEWYNGPFGYRTSHFTVCIDESSADAYCIDPTADTPPSGEYHYYIHEGGTSGTATYAAASILYQNEYHSEVFNSMWEEAMTLANVPDSDRNRFDLHDAGSRYFMIHSLVSNCWHAGEIWDAGVSEGAYQIQAHQEFKNAFSIFYTKLVLADHPQGYEVYYIDTGSAYQNIIFSNYTPTGKVQVNKQSGNIAVQNADPGSYSLDGAEYGIYATAEAAAGDENRIETLTIMNGKAVSSDLQAGTYYIREVKASKGYRLNTEILTAEISPSGITEVTSLETPNTGKIALQKYGAAGQYIQNHPDYHLEGAVYELLYSSDEQGDYKMAGEFRTDSSGTGIVTGNIYHPENAGGNVMDTLPFGYYKLKEKSPSTGYRLSPVVNTVHITEDNHLNVIPLTSEEPPVVPRFRLIKRSAVPSMTEGNSLYSLEGAVYYIYLDAACTRRADVLILDDNGIPVDHEYGVLTTGADGVSNTVHLLPGTYYVKEMMESPGYLPDSTIYTVTITNKDSEPVSLECQEIPAAAAPSFPIMKEDSEGIRMVSVNDQGLELPGVGNATLEGAEFRIAYYKAYYDSDGELPDQEDAVWIIETKYNSETGRYEAFLDQEHLADNTVSSDFYCTAQGEVAIPLGTIVITEVQAPQGYRMVTEGGSIQDQSGVLSHPYAIFQVKISDDDQDGHNDHAHIYTGERQAGQSVPIAYTVIQDQSPILFKDRIERGDLRFVKTELVSGREMDYVFFRITSSSGESHIVCTRDGGYYSSSDTKHSYKTNGWDRYYDSEGKYLGPKDLTEMKKELDQLGNCGIWFYGSADQSEWNPDMIDDTKGAFRYDTKGYLIEELPGPYNKGKQLTSRILYISNDQENVWLGNIANVDIPELQTVEWDRESQGHISAARNDEDSHIVDTVHYRNLPENSVYTIKGILMELNDDGEVTGPLMSEDGALIQGSTIIETGQSPYPSIPYVSGTEDVTYDFSGASLGGSRFVIYEYLYEGADNEPLTVQDQQVVTDQVYEVQGSKIMHADPENRDQSGNFLSIHTHALEESTEINLTEIKKAVHIKDIVDYESLTPEYEYKLVGELVYRNSSDGQILPVMDDNGSPIKVSYYFVPTKEQGSVSIDFPEFDGSQLVDDNGELLCDGVTVYETLYWNNRLIAEFKDITDSEETVYIPTIRTSAVDADTNTHLSCADSLVSIIDTCTYKNLIAGKTYTIRGTLMDRDTCRPLLDRNNKEITATATFRAENTDGIVELCYTFDGSDLQGKTAVVYEDLYYQNIRVATHADITDDQQTIYFPAIQTMLTNEDGDKEIVLTDNTELSMVDRIHYQNLIPAKSYTIKGSLRDQENGNLITEAEEICFIPEAAEGEVSVEFTVNPAQAGLLQEDGYIRDIVCFEELQETESKQVLAEHKDLQDENQTVHFLQRGRVRVRKTVDGVGSVVDRMIDLPDGTRRQITEVQKKLDVCEGVEYTVFDSETDQAVTSFRTDEEGYGYSEPLIYGDGRSYYLKETSAPSEYRLDGERYEVVFTKYDPGEFCSETELMEFHNEWKSVELQLHKQQEQITPAMTDGFLIAREDAAGVYYGIYNREEIHLGDYLTDMDGSDTGCRIRKGTLMGTMVTDANGIAVLKQYLPAGSYYCKELCSSGPEYLVDQQEYDFWIDYTGNSKDVVKIDLTPGNAFVNRYISRRVRVYKTGDTENPLSGVEFALYREMEDGYQKIGTYVTDRDGRIDLQRVPYGNYYFVETKGVDGYEYDRGKTYAFSVRDTSVECIELTVVNHKITEPKTGDQRAPLLLVLGMGIALLMYGSMSVVRHKRI